MAKALVTGGGGFIGSNLVNGLLKKGFDITVLDDFSTGDRKNLDDSIDYIKLVEGDIRDTELVGRLCSGVNVVFHLAAIPSVPRSVEEPMLSHEVNSTGTLSVLIAARDAGVERVVYAGSSSAYGDNPNLPKSEDDETKPLSPYAVGKLTGEWYCSIFYHLYGLETVVLRYFNVFGPKQNPDSEYAAVIPRFIRAIHSGGTPVVFGDGHQSRDFTFVENVVKANILASTADGVAGEVFNIACGKRYSLLDLLSELERIIGKPVNPEFRPPRQGDIMHSQADVTKAGKILGFESDIDFSEGLRRTVEFFTK